jgi:hypothetical protein
MFCIQGQILVVARSVGQHLIHKQALLRTASHAERM